jgi:hypothetical protein
MKKINVMLLVLIGCLVLVSCESATTQDLAVKVTVPTYTANIEPIFSANCVGCHSNGNQQHDFDTYTSVKENTLNGSIRCRLTGSCGDIMPQSGPLPQASIDVINLWATNGCPQ